MSEFVHASRKDQKSTQRTAGVIKSRFDGVFEGFWRLKIIGLQVVDQELIGRRDDFEIESATEDIEFLIVGIERVAETCWWKILILGRKRLPFVFLSVIGGEVSENGSAFAAVEIEIIVEDGHAGELARCGFPGLGFLLGL